MKFLILTLSLVVSTAWARNEPSVLLYSATTGHTLISEQPSTVRPLASITKLMTAIVALETGFDLDRPVPLNKRWGGVLIPKRTYTRRELFTAMLVRSDNSAAETLAGDYPGGRDEFIREMNDMARRLNMLDTHFDDASGLLATNVSSAKDIQILLSEAYRHDIIRKLTTTVHTEIVVPGRKKDTHIAIQNTNSPLLGDYSSVVLGKTGLTSKAGWCVAMILEQQQQQYYLVVLGAKDKPTRTKIASKAIKGLDLH